jgi:hypothetical protein
METKVILCDKCKLKVAKSICKICGADVCGDCFSETPVFFAYNNALVKFNVCNCCKRDIEDMLRRNKHDKQIFEELIVKYLKNSLVLEELEKPLAEENEPKIIKVLTQENLESIDKATNEIMDMIRGQFHLNPDSDQDDKIYGCIHNRLKDLVIGEL